MDGDGNDSRVSKDSATAKARSTYRKQDRRVRENYKTGTFHGGDDDF